MASSEEAALKMCETAGIDKTVIVKKAVEEKMRVQGVAAMEDFVVEVEKTNNKMKPRERFQAVAN